ncbi:hypothetical protein BH11VER1_BH11VER1_13280 [soil metagenome]
MVKASVPAKKSASKKAKRMRIGFVALTDCAPLLVAESLGFFADHHLDVELTREIGWATIREKIYYHQLDAAHAIAGLGLSLRLGFDGRQCNAINPFVFNIHGNAITLSKDLWRRGVRNAESLHKLIRSTSQKLFTFGIVERSSSHHFLLRRWLKSGGVDPSKDVRLVVLPPTQMVESMRAGLIDGYCAGEPWNSLAVAEGIGWCPAVSQDIMPGHPEKVLLTTEEFAEEEPEKLKSLMCALYQACAYCDQPENRTKVVNILHKSGHIRVDRTVLERALSTPFDDGCGTLHPANEFHIFHRRDANEPSSDKADWLLREFLAHGLIQTSQLPVVTKALAACWRSDLFHQACIQKTPVKKNKAVKNAPTPVLV